MPSLVRPRIKDSHAPHVIRPFRLSPNRPPEDSAPVPLVQPMRNDIVLHAQPGNDFDKQEFDTDEHQTSASNGTTAGKDKSGKGTANVVANLAYKVRVKLRK